MKDNQHNFLTLIITVFVWVFRWRREREQVRRLLFGLWAWLWNCCVELLLWRKNSFMERCFGFSSFSISTPTIVKISKVFKVSTVMYGADNYFCRYKSSWRLQDHNFYNAHIFSILKNKTKVTFKLNKYELDWLKWISELLVGCRSRNLEPTIPTFFNFQLVLEFRR